MTVFFCPSPLAVLFWILADIARLQRNVPRNYFVLLSARMVSRMLLLPGGNQLTREDEQQVAKHVEDVLASRKYELDTMEDREAIHHQLCAIIAGISEMGP